MNAILLCIDTKERIFLGKVTYVDSDKYTGVWRAGLSDLEVKTKLLQFMLDRINCSFRLVSDQVADSIDDLNEYRRVDDDYGDPI